MTVVLSMHKMYDESIVNILSIVTSSYVLFTTINQINQINDNQMIPKWNPKWNDLWLCSL